MTGAVLAHDVLLEARARQSLGTSNGAIYRMVERALDARNASGRLVDVGCGAGHLMAALRGRFSSCCGLDAVRYEGLPADCDFVRVDLDAADWPIAGSTADVVTAIEVIEHLENPWAFTRQLARLVKPGGLVVVTTPNQLSALSLLTLVAKRRFAAFHDVHYPAHRTALLECDLHRAAQASGLSVLETSYSLCGRLPLVGWHYPVAVSACLPRALSDNVMMVAVRPSDASF
jgi:2-polyprenyl-3-methyl-5-hydroxy-6-metoxy-1,4-benzoquinol methylase